VKRLPRRLDHPQPHRSPIHPIALALTRFGGHVAKCLGDGVMDFFGYPEAHDNDAERAARAGLRSSRDIEAQRTACACKVVRKDRHRFRRVVVGAGAGRDADVFGDAPNIAARAQAMAAPGAVLITSDTHRLVSGPFVLENRDEARKMRLDQ
jgi:class 3 adenylate cyclase